MKIIRTKDYADMSRKAANIISAQVIMKPDCVLGLATGGTPVGTYEKLVERYNEGDLDFSEVTSVNLDEYRGLPKDHPESYWSFMHRNLFDHVNIDPAHINLPDGTNMDADAECARYDAVIHNVGGVDLQLLGMGHNGHIAFNEPYSSLVSRTRVMTLTPETIAVNSRFFDNDVNKVPRQAMSVGVATIMDAREVIIQAFGHKKARALKHGVEGCYSHEWTISALQVHPAGIIVADEAAVGELKVNTYRYFRELEKSERL